MKALLNLAVKQVSLLLAPPYCAYCKIFLSDPVIYCDSCFRLIEPIASIAKPITTTKSIKIFAASPYDGPMKQLVLAKGFSHELASIHMAQMIWDRAILQSIDFDYLVPTPLHWTRQLRRGYNQTEVMARELSYLSGKPCVSLVKRDRMTRYQSSLSPVKRVENVQAAFSLVEPGTKKYHGKTLVIVDDLMTTGATITMLAKQLLLYKPKAIFGVVACRVK